MVHVSCEISRRHEVVDEHQGQEVRRKQICQSHPNTVAWPQLLILPEYVHVASPFFEIQQHIPCNNSNSNYYSNYCWHDIL